MVLGFYRGLERSVGSWAGAENPNTRAALKAKFKYWNISGECAMCRKKNDGHVAHLAGCVPSTREDLVLAPYEPRHVMKFYNPNAQVMETKDS